MAAAASPRRPAPLRLARRRSRVARLVVAALFASTRALSVLWRSASASRWRARRALLRAVIPPCRSAAAARSDSARASIESSRRATYAHGGNDGAARARFAVGQASSSPKVVDMPRVASTAKQHEISESAPLRLFLGQRGSLASRHTVSSTGWKVRSRADTLESWWRIEFVAPVSAFSSSNSFLPLNAALVLTSRTRVEHRVGVGSLAAVRSVRHVRVEIDLHDRPRAALVSATTPRTAVAPPFPAPFPSSRDWRFRQGRQVVAL